MSIPTSQYRTVLMKDHEEYILHGLGAERRTILYLAASESEQRAFYSVLAPKDKVGGLLEKSAWEFRPGEGGPSFSTGSKGTTYDRLGHNEGIEPIIHVRSQRGDDVVELIEEFRLLYDLYYGPNHELFRWTETGDKEIVGLVSPQKAEIRAGRMREECWLSFGSDDSGSAGQRSPRHRH